MKNLLLFITIAFLSLSSYCQTSFNFDANGLNPKYIVIEIDSLNSSELYNKTINWIKETYKNPDEVIKAKFENEKVRFNGFQKSAMSTKMLGIPTFTDVRYSIEISFKDGKFKFEPISLEKYTTSSQYVVGGWSSVTLDIGSGIYKNNGKIKGIFQNYPIEIADIFNNLKSSLEIYLLKQNNTIKDKKKDW